MAGERITAATNKQERELQKLLQKTYDIGNNILANFSILDARKDKPSGTTEARQKMFEIQSWIKTHAPKA